MIVELPPGVLSGYRRAFRGPRWADVSITLRVEHNACEICRLRPREMHVLEAAHLVAEVELWALGLRDAYLVDRRGLACLCGSCHTAFDLVVCGVRDAS